MAMNVQADDHSEDPDLNTTINTTPLVDVMLVLLIIFLVTIPVIVKTVPVQLPNARNIATITKPENIVVAVDKDENVYYNNEPIDVTELKDRFKDALLRAISAGHPLPEVHIRADKEVRFQAVGRVVLACQIAGIQKVGFLTEPHNDQPQ
ncbi:MAG: biopolymer transporter ExbD [Alphaproteobacteria bacterium]|nr:biopolymer transporter ExbD [Alphaproteobacteria bacterium]MBV9539733.1 biopolymer transporter ExbD [Alphaproteobacteria bacterium]MBV9903446.1 biopolymer transporter ExbD [Alphaproteobacteria bacterium]